jgi:hypothetical protein
MSLVRRCVLLALLLVMGLSCSNSAPPAEEPPLLMAFTLSPHLLGESFSLAEPAFSFQAPAGWDKVDSTRLGQLAGLLREDQDQSVILNLEAVFLDARQGCTLVLSRWQSDSVRTWREEERRQRQRLDERFAGKALQHATYLLQDQLCLQSLVQDSLIVNFKLMLANGLLLDFLVPRQIYETQVELIESSLGSMSFPSTSTPE